MEEIIFPAKNDWIHIPTDSETVSVVVVQRKRLDTFAHKQNLSFGNLINISNHVHLAEEEKKQTCCTNTLQTRTNSANIIVHISTVH